MVKQITYNERTSKESFEIWFADKISNAANTILSIHQQFLEDDRGAYLIVSIVYAPSSPLAQASILGPRKVK